MLSSLIMDSFSYVKKKGCKTIPRNSTIKSWNSGS